MAPLGIASLRFPAHFAVATLVAAVLWSPVPASAEDGTYACRDNAKLARLSAPLAHMRRLIALGRPITIAALGSSSTAGAGASSPQASYPARLEAELRKRFPGVKVVRGDAAELGALLRPLGIDTVAAVVSSLPLLSMPKPLFNLQNRSGNP